jgi:hypothetical protein
LILGLDISTSIIGWCLLTKDGTYVDVGHIDLRKVDNFYDKCKEFHFEIINNFNQYLLRDAIKEVWVEEPVKMFRSNASMAQTITKLQRFNATCCWILYQIFGTEPKMIMATSARKKAGVKVPRGSDTKKLILQYVQNLGIIPEYKWALKKTGNPKDFCFDQADACIVALAGLKHEERSK